MSTLGPKVMERFRHPQRAGLPEMPGLAIGNGTAGQVESGAVVRFRVGLDDTGRIAGTGWECFGCPSTIASADWLAEYAEGRLPQDLCEPLPTLLARELDLDPAYLSRVLVVEDAFRAALADASGKSE